MEILHNLQQYSLMQTGNQKYLRALTRSRDLVDVRNITPATRRDGAPYMCIGCGEELIPKIGSKRAHHFAHKHTVDCSSETYLHAAAKLLFVRNYRDRLATGRPFYIEFRRPTLCDHLHETLGSSCEDYRWERYDLTKVFRQVEVEKGIQGVVADVLLSTDDGNTLLIEIAVTHESEPEKIAKRLKIVEVSVSCEDDLELFSQDHLSEQDDRVAAYHLDTQPVRGNICSGRCTKAIEGLIIYDSGKAFLLQVDVQKWITQRNSKRVAHAKLIGPPRDPAELHYLQMGACAGETFKKAIREAVFTDKAPAKHCYNCKYHGAASIEGRVYCKTYKHSVQNGNNAASCDRYARFRTLEEAELADKANSEWVEKRSFF